MKTLADLKRYLQPNARLTMTYNSWTTHHKLPWDRQVVETQTNGVWLIDPTIPESKKSFLEFPKASRSSVWENEKDYTWEIYEANGECSLRYSIPK